MSRRRASNTHSGRGHPLHAVRRRKVWQACAPARGCGNGGCRDRPCLGPAWRRRIARRIDRPQQWLLRSQRRLFRPQQRLCRPQRPIVSRQRFHGTSRRPSRRRSSRTAPSPHTRSPPGQLHRLPLSPPLPAVLWNRTALRLQQYLAQPRLLRHPQLRLLRRLLLRQPGRGARGRRPGVPVRPAAARAGRRRTARPLPLRPTSSPSPSRSRRAPSP